MNVNSPVTACTHMNTHEHTASVHWFAIMSAIAANKVFQTYLFELYDERHTMEYH